MSAIRDGSTVFYDLSNDIESCTVNRKQNGPSDFTIHLQNKNQKYNDLFIPLDRITIYAIKTGERIRLLTGYIKSARVYTLYPNSMEITGACSFYRLTQLYWDPGLMASQLVQGFGESAETGWDWSLVIFSLLTEVAGYNPKDILLGKVPDAVINWAQQMWKAKQEDYTQANDMLKEFYEVLGSVGAYDEVGGGGTGTMSGDSNQEKVYTYMRSVGASKAAAAAVVGNAMAESGCDPSRQQSGGPAWGLFQMEAGRLAAMIAYAASKGKDKTDLRCQLEFMESELPGVFDTYTGRAPYYYSSGEWAWWPDKVSYEQWKQWTDVAKATECFCRVFERPSIPHMENRIAFAKDALASFGSK